MTARWDPVVRTTHWIVALGFLANRFYVTNPGSSWHEYIGYAVITCVLLRLLWGISFARGPARLSALFHRWSSVKSHIAEVQDRTAHQQLGHNPFGSVAIWLFWVGLLLVGFTGWGQETDLIDSWPLDDWHMLLVDALTVLVCIHIFAVFALSLWLHRNLIRAMLPGKSR